MFWSLSEARRWKIAELWREIEEARQIMPEIQPLLLMQVAGKVAL